MAVEPYKIKVSCGLCGGDGLIPQGGGGTTPCTVCNGLGYAYSGLLEGAAEQIADLTDKVDDVLDKCNDILEKLNEP